MQIPESAIAPSTAELDVWKYIVALKDDDWEDWDAIPRDSRFNGARRGSVGRWNLRGLDGAPVDWSYADDEVVVLEVLDVPA
ncbi:Uncharacterised protein (plasmid) [Tsukamurella tyrosinosolvens]|uniref:Uncharacterized protein n=1 Tax=Tsukamurella tyrosinosolvens TaxID=57704 RepID=A0A1H4V8K8_TSUTY|nr:hypothetical protein [Tsukamurella tyrosinosolvens]KXO91024.1 hypothetical protein AXK58_21580 [Tsukamurella tyrosinosolvens]SEC77255.1 hypothetical protein SAMN04489793_3173 [Tsukamurella tyrosinosolvens]VEH90627.1 Uncharacterised protein [Tsukamurella tyrosinosolvens]